MYAFLMGEIWGVGGIANSSVTYSSDVIKLEHKKTLPHFRERVLYHKFGFATINQSIINNKKIYCHTERRNFRISAFESISPA